MTIRVEKFLIQSGDTILSAIRRMDSAHRGIALVADADGRLVGVVTDSDVRRAILNGVDLDSPVDIVMTRDPVVVHEGESDQEVVRLLQSARYRTRDPALIPVIDKNGRLVRLHPSSELLTPSDSVQERVGIDARPSKVLLLGGAGYIGSVLSRLLLDAGYQVTVLDRFLYGEASIQGIKEQPLFNVVHGDTRHIDNLVPVIRNAEAVVHLAELVGDPLCAQDPQTTFEINYLGTASIARVCAYLQVNRFLYLSSCSVYGASSNSGAVLDERSELDPVSLYAKMKMRSERVILGMENGNFSPCIFRLGTVFGFSYRPRFDLVVNTLTAKAVKEGEIEIFGGDQWRPHVHVADVARAIQMALESPIEHVGNQVFNVIGENQRIDDVGKMVAELLPGTNVVQKDTVVDKRNYRVSGDKAEEILGFKPTMSVRDGIREIAEALESGKIQDYKDKRYHNNLLAFEGESFGD